MSIAFACPFCTRKYRVADDLGGRKVKCKDCGSELRIPKPEPVAARAEPEDVYGLDESAAPPPPSPSRLGAPAPEEGEAEAPAKARRKAAKSSLSQENQDQFRQFGRILMTLGGLSFVLPLIGLQIKGLHAMPPEAQAACGVGMIALGAFLFLASMMGMLRALGLAVGGGFGLLVVAFAVGLLKGDDNQAAPAAPAPRQAPFVPPPQVAAPAPESAPDEAAPATPPAEAPAEPAPEPSADATPAHSPEAPASAPPTPPPGARGKLVISGGRVSASRGMGVTVSVDYRNEGGGGGLYDLIVRTRKGKTKIVPPVHVGDSGTLEVSVSGMDRGDGPFSAALEPHRPGLRSGVRDSDFVGLSWTEAPAPAQPNPPGFRRPGSPTGGPSGPRGPRFGPRGPR